MIFVDTSGWVALLDPDDPDHARVDQRFSTNRDILVTTDYVVDETLTFLRSHGKAQRANAAGEVLFGEVVARLRYLTPDDVRSAWAIFRRYHDKEWSFTDCASKHVIEAMGIRQAVSLDHHFRQFGNVEVLP